MSNWWWVRGISLGTGDELKWGPFPSRRVAKRWIKKNGLETVWAEKERA